MKFAATGNGEKKKFNLLTAFYLPETIVIIRGISVLLCLFNFSSQMVFYLKVIEKQCSLIKVLSPPVRAQKDKMRFVTNVLFVKQLHSHFSMPMLRDYTRDFPVHPLISRFGKGATARQSKHVSGGCHFSLLSASNSTRTHIIKDSRAHKRYSVPIVRCNRPYQLEIVGAFFPKDVPLKHVRCRALQN